MSLNRLFLKHVHQFSGLLVGTFIVFHLLNHLMALFGIEAHLFTMELFRKVYRNPILEALLFISIASQIGSGLYFAFKFKVRTQWDRLQKWSGIYLAFFFIMHLSGVLGFGRGQLGIDTNFYFAATPLLIYPYKIFFIPYYGLAVLSVFVHGAAIYEHRGISRGRKESFSWSPVILTIGTIAALALINTFSGAFYQITSPDEYMAMFQ